MAGSNEAFLRHVNLVEILKEELEDAGEQLPPDLTDEQLQCMTEADIRQHYRQAPDAQAAAKPQQLPQAQAEQLKHRFPSQDEKALFRSWFPALSASRTQHLAPAQPKAVVLCFHSSGNAEDMYTSEGTGSRCACTTACRPLSVSVRAVHGQQRLQKQQDQHGKATQQPLTGCCRRVQSALLDACKANGWLLLAPQLPGRGQRLKERPLDTLQVGIGSCRLF